MISWSDGYVTEIEYTHGFYRELAPAHLRFALLCAGLSLPPEQGFTWAELGCGQGFTANLVAAANPQGHFFATDFNPSHIATAHRFQSAAALDNITFSENSFEQYVEADLPPLDYVCLHGIYSWISPENRAHIVEFMRRHLKPSGVVYISYNCYPGWAALMPLQRLIYEQGQASGGPILERVDQALQFVQRLSDSDSGYFKVNPLAVQRLGQLQKQNRHYLAHEYFNEHWHPLFVTQVAAELSPAKLMFAASANLLDHIDALNIPQSARELFASVKDPLQRQLLKDYLINQQFRRDLFIRGAVRLSSLEQLEKLRQQGFVLTQPAASIPFKFQSALGEVSLQADIYRPLIEVLSQGPATLGQLTQHADLKQLSLERLLEALMVLVGANWAAPTLPEADLAQRRQSTERFNQAVLDQSQYGADLQFLASPLTGSGVGLDRIEQLLLVGLIRKQAAAAFAWGVLSAQKQTLVKDGQPLKTAEENLQELRQKETLLVQQRLPLLKQLQVVA
ncbi:MAG: methyltransferase regulatory domain-containing protein [Cyanobacteria bacterium Co-bin13]|nr:methyltransferase regulatory domain-containing protein [Cyanobacteria bacterium Co-bin13]